MGQYWQFVNRTKRECISAHHFGVGMKFREQLHHGPIYSALMILSTDTSSMGDGMGDPHLDLELPHLQELIKAFLGHWAGDQLMFVGDYSENDPSDDLYKDVSYEDLSRRLGNAGT